jgi:predicted outer membrane protein
MKPAILSGAAALIALLASSNCSTGETTPPARSAGAAIRPPPATPAIVAMPSSLYFRQATAIDLFQLRAADIALQRGSGSARSFALESRRQHQAISAQMAFAGRYLDMLPSRDLPAEYQQMLATLLSTGDFNTVYLAQQRRIGERALKLHGDYAKAGQSPTLRPVAKFAASAIASELRLLDR